MGRTSDAQQRLVDAAHELMATRGYVAAGVAEICRRADVQKGSFYHFYDSKQALTLSVVTAHWAAQRRSWEELLAGPDPALTCLRRLLEAEAQGQREARARTGAVRGCLLANLALELSNQDETVTAALAGAFEEQVDLVLAALERAAVEGAVPAAVATRDTARSVIAQLEGLVLFATTGNDPSVLDGLWGQVRLLLGLRDPQPA